MLELLANRCDLRQQGCCRRAYKDVLAACHSG
jgi:hypothetical protein